MIHWPCACCLLALNFSACLWLLLCFGCQCSLEAAPGWLGTIVHASCGTCEHNHRSRGRQLAIRSGYRRCMRYIRNDFYLTAAAVEVHPIYIYIIPLACQDETAASYIS